MLDRTHPKLIFLEEMSEAEVVDSGSKPFLQEICDLLQITYTNRMTKSDLAQLIVPGFNNLNYE